VVYYCAINLVMYAQEWNPKCRMSARRECLSSRILPTTDATVVRYSSTWIVAIGWWFILMLLIPSCWQISSTATYVSRRTHGFWRWGESTPLETASASQLATLLLSMPRTAINASLHYSNAQLRFQGSPLELVKDRHVPAESRKDDRKLTADRSWFSGCYTESRHVLNLRPGT